MLSAWRWRSPLRARSRTLIPEGVVVLRDANPPHRAPYLVARDSAPYLVPDNCIYGISGGSDVRNQQLTPKPANTSRAALSRPTSAFPSSPACLGK